MMSNVRVSVNSLRCDTKQLVSQSETVLMENTKALVTQVAKSMANKIVETSKEVTDPNDGKITAIEAKIENVKRALDERVCRPKAARPVWCPTSGAGGKCDDDRAV